ncbi:hypothetical protein [Cohnella panacarvi]|uniref:hypothetical protein n=1 Tax=Cohnella panacarvi TaxID=400776 RepID=UPI00047C237D|nr:hypothetical protein [Cohnella panacarvi]
MDFHSLNGVDMVAAITQDTLNYHWSKLFKKGIFSSSLSIDTGSSGIKLNAKLNAPIVQFNKSAVQATSLLVLSMSSGTFTYQEGTGSHHVDFKNWVYAFDVSLSLAVVNGEDLKRSDVVPDAVSDQLKAFNNSLYSIQHLFVDFQNTDFTSYDPSLTQLPFPDNSTITPDQLEQFQQALASYFSSLQGAYNPYVLGYCVSQLPNHTGLQPETFTPTSYNFSTFSDPSTPGLSTLNYLIMTQEKIFPSNTMAGVYFENWVTSSDYDGKFIVSPDILWYEWLIPSILYSLGIQQQVNAMNVMNGWTVSQSNSNQTTEPDSITCISKATMVDGHTNTTDQRSVQIVYTNDSSTKVKVKLSGTFTMTYRVDFTCILHEWMEEDATLNWSGKIKIEAGDNGQIKLDLEELIVPDATRTTNGNWLGKADITMIPNNKKTLDQIGDQFEKTMKNNLQRFQNMISGVYNCLVLPSGDEYFYANPQMAQDANLLLDITLKSN